MEAEITQGMVPYSGPSELWQAAQVADQVARGYILEEYLAKIAGETRRRQCADIALFERYLSDAGVIVHDLAVCLSPWQDVSDGLVSGFLRWQLAQGYAIGSVNVRLATIKAYGRLAMRSGYLSIENYQRIQVIDSIRRKEGRNIDEKRVVTRLGKKKAQATRLAPAHVNLIKRELRKQADGDPFFASSLLLFCLLTDLGLRCGEVAALQCDDIDLAAGQLRFYRHKVDKSQVHQLPPDVFAAAKLHVAVCSPIGPLFSGKPPGKSLATRTINWRVGEMGRLVGIEDLSPHDLRHYWATYSKGDLGALQQAGGWNSLAMPLLYREESAIANEGLTVPGGVL